MGQVLNSRHRPGLTQFQKRTLLTSCDLTKFFEFQYESISISDNFHLYLTQIAKIREISVVKLQYTKLNSRETRKMVKKFVKSREVNVGTFLKLRQPWPMPVD